MREFNGKELLCEITGMKKVNPKEYQLLLNPEIAGLDLKISAAAADEYWQKYGRSSLYLALSDYCPEVEKMEAMKLRGRNIWNGVVRKSDGAEIPVTGTVLPAEAFAVIHKQAGTLWERVIHNTADFLESRERANEYVARYLLRALRQDPLDFSRRRSSGCVSCLESVAAAIWMRREQAKSMGLRLPTSADLERWLCAHAVTALQRKVVFLKNGKLFYDIEKMELAYYNGGKSL